MPRWLQILDVACSFSLLAFVILSLITYILLARRSGRRHYARVDKQGSSQLLNRSTMEYLYWSLQAAGSGLNRMGMSPNGISSASGVTGIGAGAALACGLFGVGAFLATLSAFLDILDGMVARARGTASDAGEVFDAAVDRYTEYAFFGGLMIAYRSIPLMQVLALVAMIGSAMVTYSTAKSEALHVTVPSALMRRHERSAYLITGAAFSGFSVFFWERGHMATPIGIPLTAALVVVAVVANVAAIRRFRAIMGAVQARDSAA